MTLLLLNISFSNYMEVSKCTYQCYGYQSKQKAKMQSLGSIAKVTKSFDLQKRTIVKKLTGDSITLTIEAATKINFFSCTTLPT